MSERLSTMDKAILETIARTRGLRTDPGIKYEELKPARTQQALRKILERLRDKGFLAASPVLAGSQMFRLSIKGVAATGAPQAWATSPSVATTAEMIAASSLAWRTNDFLFLTKSECEKLFSDGAPTAEPPKFIGRFLLRLNKGRASNGSPEPRLDVLLAELRPAEALVRRAGVMIDRLRQNSATAELLDLGLLGITITVPSAGVKASLQTKSLPVETSIVIIKELQDLLSR